MVCSSSFNVPALLSGRKIWLTRHGESEYNEQNRIGGNSSLSGKGKQYAQALPGALEARLARLPQLDRASVTVLTSKLQRTIETAQNLSYPKSPREELNEINAGVCDGMTYEEIAKEYPDDYQDRQKDKLRYTYPKGESYLDVIGRVKPVIEEIKRTRGCVVVVAHQAVLRAVFGIMMGIDEKEIPTLSIPLHTLIELTPQPGEKYLAERFPVSLNEEPGSLMAAAAAVSRTAKSEAVSHTAVLA